MAVIAVYSVKGGVGKTTIATNLAWQSAVISCRKTLLWDLDAAGGAGFLLGVEPKPKRAAKTVFSRDLEPEQLIRKTRYPGLDLLPADESLRDLAEVFANAGKRQRLAKITDALEKSYDRIILDCPPVLNEISRQVVRAADCVVVPPPPSPLSARAYQLVADEIAANSKQAPAILPVLSMVDRRRNLHRQLLEEQPKWPVIPLASAIEQCAVRREPVGAYAPQSIAARQLGSLWTAIERQLAKRK